ncbi:MAG: HAD family phosphatase [Chloroflexi bacterium]|nr:HAD family phosphatase [Chloroflexota bacterium]
MIRAIIFDLDGTLVQTERLKAISYAQAAVELRPDTVTEAAVMAAFRDVVGLSRNEVATTLVERFGLAQAAGERMTEFGVDTPWQAYIQLRLRHYETLLADPDVLRRNQWPHAVNLLRAARLARCKVGLATMSYCAQVQRVLDILDLNDQFDFVASRDDVEHGKPDPEIYLLVAHELGVPAAECLVIEDSPSGVKAALAAGMHVIAVSTPFTQEGLHNGHLLNERWIVDDPATLPSVVQELMNSPHTSSV